MSGFRRVVVELGHGAADLAAMREAAAYAQLLDAELHALFVEDETLLATSALPFAREINPLSLQWRKLEPERMEAELRATAERARRHVMATADAVGIRRTFEIRRGDLAVMVTETCVVTDIVVVAPPLRETPHGSRRLRETADRSAASVLHLPPKPGRRHGPVVVAVSGDNDPALAVARLIAAQYRERLLVLGEEQRAARFLPGTSAPDIATTLGETRERLIVVTRVKSPDRTSGAWADLAAVRGVPVLVVEPG
jgi:hypothetical protein